MSNELRNGKLLQIRNKFLCCVPVSDIDFKDVLSSISWEEQHFLLNQTVKNALIKAYPIKLSYQRAFLKAVIEILEKSCVDIHDEWYDTFCEILSCEDCDKYYFKHYIVEDKVVSLKENKNFISEGTTGLCSWQASLALSQWCLNNKNFLDNKTILELGSGVGLVGLTIETHCNPKSIILSDCHPTVLSILSENVTLNTKNNQKKLLENGEKVTKNCASEKFCESNKHSFLFADCAKKTFGAEIGISGREIDLSDNSTVGSDFGVVRKAGFSVTNSRISVVDLAWEDVGESEFCARVAPNLILAADVVYDNSVFKSLCGVVKYFLGRNCEADVIFACTERNPDTLQEFLDLLEANSFVIEHLATPQSKDFVWSDAVPIRFLHIRHK